MTRQMIYILLHFLLFTKAYAQKDKYDIVTKDVLNFWEAVDSLKENCDTTQIFQALVIDRATKEFRIFIRQWKMTAKNYTYQYGHYPKFYKTLRKNCFRLIENKNLIKETIDNFKKIYPGYVDASICISLGNFSTGGTTSIIDDGPLIHNKFVYIGLEYHGLDSSTIISELPEWARDYVSRSNFYRTIIHELVHIQQMTHGYKIAKAYQKNNLSASVLREGIPDFISKLIYPFGNNGNYFNYGIVHEEMLKVKLANEMHGSDLSYWMYNTNTATDQPRDLGYFMGSRIANSFFNHLPAASKDITDLIEIKNAKNFNKKSKYFE
jgi:hypothetical protein